MGERPITRRPRQAGLLRLIDPRWSSGTASLYEQRTLFDRGVLFAARMMPPTFLVVAVSLSVLMVVLPVEAGWFQWFWPTTVVVTNGAFMAFWIVRRRIGGRSATVADFGVLQLQAAVWALLLVWLARRLFPDLDDDDQLVFASTVVGAVSVGLFALSMFRIAALSWVVIMGAGLGWTFWLEPAPTRYVLLGTLAVYLVALYGGSRALADLFVTRIRAEVASQDERDLVDLLLSDLEDEARDWLWEADRHAVLPAVTYRFAEHVGLPAAKLRGRTLREILVGIGADTFAAGPQTLERLDTFFADGSSFHDVRIRVRVGGLSRWWSFSGHPVREAGVVSGWRGVGSDVTHSHQQRENILRLAEIDSLTGLRNRYSLTSRLSSMIEGDRVVWFAILDLDNFKSINDRFGHNVGDDVLRDVAARLDDVVRPPAICARLGGDEFAIAFEESGADIAARFQAALGIFDEPYAVAGNEIRLRGSLGYGSYPEDTNSLDGLLIVADLALYQAKAAGRNRIGRFDSTLREKANGRARALLDLRRASNADEFSLAYQPQVAAGTGVLVGFEALLRWNHPTSGTVAPADFISVAEETGLIVPIGAQALRKACAEAASWPVDIRIAVNVSQVQLRSSGYVESVRETLTQYGIDPRRLEIEVTESLVIDAADRDVLVQLSELGVAIAMDDFGTGFSSVASLADLPLDRLKIDRALVDPLGTEGSESRIAVFRSIVVIASSLGLETIAEGVETERQRTIVADCGCTVIQGYLEGQPMLPDDVHKVIAEYQARAVIAENG
ncbi:diguanylate cyclase (GGDEF)-like protein [Rhodococcus sp. 27YEA15]|uniref:putative bifunctional diguanylate cyclase/phosphodiesterase n=1 Tax=Rhodococcus sp. 27YEA15 TaxID=3156259 RepID=UPI003C7C1417